MKADERMTLEMLHDGMCCSQVITTLGLKLYGEENPTMVEAASGMCMGIHAGLACGTLIAGAQILAMFDKKNAAGYMIPQLWEWFDEGYGKRYGDCRCSSLSGSKPSPALCSGLIVSTWRAVKDILAESGVEIPEDI